MLSYAFWQRNRTETAYNDAIYVKSFYFFQEESEMRSDGTLSTVKPSQMCAARITVVRG